MNRRNIMGEQVSESKTTWIVLIGIVATMLSYGIYYFLDTGWLGLLLMSVCVLLGCAGVHLLTGELTELFAYLLIPCVFSGTMGGLTMSSSIKTLPESGTMFLTALLVWFLTVAYAAVVTWSSGNAASLNFPDFYKRAAILFYAVYIGLFIYGLFVIDRAPAEAGKLQLVPFATLAAYIEAMINKTVSFLPLMYYLLYHMVFFIPYGFLIALACSRLPAAVRVLLLAALPLVSEAVQYFLGLNSCDVDDFIFGFIGGLFGMIFFLLFNFLFVHFTGKTYNGKDADRDYYGSAF